MQLIILSTTHFSHTNLSHLLQACNGTGLLFTIWLNGLLPFLKKFLDIIFSISMHDIVSCPAISLHTLLWLTMDLKLASFYSKRIFNSNLRCNTFKAHLSKLLIRHLLICVLLSRAMQAPLIVLVSMICKHLNVRSPICPLWAYKTSSRSYGCIWLFSDADMKISECILCLCLHGFRTGCSIKENILLCSYAMRHLYFNFNIGLYWLVYCFMRNYEEKAESLLRYS